MNVIPCTSNDTRCFLNFLITPFRLFTSFFFHEACSTNANYIVHVAATIEEPPVRRLHWTELFSQRDCVWQLTQNTKFPSATGVFWGAKKLETWFKSRESGKKNNIIQFCRDILYHLVNAQLEKNSPFNKTLIVLSQLPLVKKEKKIGFSSLNFQNSPTELVLDKLGKRIWK